MNTNVDVINPAQRRLDAESYRKQEGKAGNSTLTAIFKAINDAPACATTSPMIVFGVRTNEYCIVPCPTRDDTALEVIQHLEGRGYYVTRFRQVKLDGQYNVFTHALLVVWDRRILRKSIRPRYYTVRDKDQVPCGNCYMHARDPEGVKKCEGCDVLAMWLPGVACLKGRGNPCSYCRRHTEGKGREVCTACPALAIWKKQNSEAEATDTKPADLPVEDAEESPIPLVSATSKSANAPSASMAEEDMDGAEEGDGQTV